MVMMRYLYCSESDDISKDTLSVSIRKGANKCEFAQNWSYAAQKILNISTRMSLLFFFQSLSVMLSLTFVSYPDQCKPCAKLSMHFELAAKSLAFSVESPPCLRSIPGFGHDARSLPIWTFPEMGLPHFHAYVDGFFPYKPSSYGVPP